MLFSLIINVAELASDYFISYSYRPIKSFKIGTWSDDFGVTPLMAIVIQGPIVIDNNFTLETIRLYKKHFPESLIVVSTWENESQSQVEKIRKENVELILNKKLSYGGPHNINFQLTSSIEGIKRVQNLGAEYVLKTRTDQRIYAPNALRFLYNLVNLFPLKNDKQKKRIASASLATLKYRPYGVSDMTVFGHIDDMLAYWDAPLDMRTVSFNEDDNIRQFAKVGICEVYLAKNFLKTVGREIKDTLTDSWEAYAEHFIIFDYQTLDIYWHKPGIYWGKYTRHNEQRFIDYDTIRNNRLLTFADWFNLYANNGGQKPPDEKTLDTSFGNPTIK